MESETLEYKRELSERKKARLESNRAFSISSLLMSEIIPCLPLQPLSW